MNQTIRRTAVLAALAMAALAACGSDDSADLAAADTTAAESAPVATAPTTDDETSPAAAGFPLTIEHKFGSTTIDAPPERISVVGLTEQDALIALGVVPVTTTEWFGEYDGAVWPWAQDDLAAVDAAPPQALDFTDGYQFEQIAAAQPDLIIGLYSGLTQEEYDLLTEIAPTVAQPADYVDWGIPWDEATLTLGSIVGKSAEAQAIVDSVSGRFEAARAEHPEFIGASGAMATPYDGIFVYSGEDPRGRILAALGFELPADLNELAGDDFGATLSAEQAEYVDLDALVWLDMPADAEAPALAVYRALAVHTEGRDMFLSSLEPLGGATSFVTPLSLPYLLDSLVPMLAAAVDGDPATPVPD